MGSPVVKEIMSTVPKSVSDFVETFYGHPYPFKINETEENNECEDPPKKSDEVPIEDKDTD